MKRPTEVEDLLRRHAPQVLGALVRRYGHFDAAEDAVQEALLAAAEQWPRAGLPDNPRGWLIKVASRRLTDALRSEEGAAAAGGEGGGADSAMGVPPRSFRPWGSVHGAAAGGGPCPVEQRYLQARAARLKP